MQCHEFYSIKYRIKAKLIRISLAFPSELVVNNPTWHTQISNNHQSLQNWCLHLRPRPKDFARFLLYELKSRSASQNLSMFVLRPMIWTTRTCPLLVPNEDPDLWLSFWQRTPKGRVSYQDPIKCFFSPLTSRCPRTPESRCQGFYSSLRDADDIFPRRHASHINN